MSYRQVPTSEVANLEARIRELIQDRDESLKHQSEYFAALESCITIREALKKERDALSREVAAARPVVAAAIMFEECSDDAGSNRLINAVLAMKRTGEGKDG